MSRSGVPSDAAFLGIGFLLAAATLALQHLQPGWPRMGDGHGLLAQTWLFREALREGEWPGWTFHWYGGWSFTRAYGPLFPAIPGILDLFLDNPKRSVVLYVFGCRLLGLLTAYLCARRLGLGAKGAFFVSIFYTFCGQQSQSILRYGEFNLSLFYALAPLPLYLLAKGLAGGSVGARNVILAAFVQAALLLNHIELGAYSLAGVFAIVLLSFGFDRERPLFRGMRPLSAFALLSIGLAAFFVVQFVVTREFTLLGRESLNLSLRPNLDLVATLFDTEYLESHSWSIQYFGALSAILLFVGAVVAIRSRSPWGIACLRGLAVIFTLLLFAGRYRMLNYLVLPAALLVGVGVERIDEWVRTRKWMKGRKPRADVLLLFAAALLVFDHSRLLPHGQYPYRATVGYFETLPTVNWFGERAREDGVFGRTLQIRPSLEASVWSDMEPLVTGHPTLAGGNIETAPRTFPYLAAFVEALVQSVHGGKAPTVDLQDFALLFGLRFVAHSGEAAAPIKWGEPIPSEGPHPCRELTGYSPILASESVALWEGETSLDRLPGSSAWRPQNLDLSQLEWIENRMGVDRDGLTCRVLLFREPPSSEIESPASEEESFRFRFLSERVGQSRVEIRFETSRPCYLRTAYPIDPRLEFRLNGETVQPIPTAMHFSGLVCPDVGKHHLEIRAGHLPVERFGWAVSLIAWIGALGGLARSVWNMK